MEFILRQGQPGLKQDILIYGKEYKLWRDGIFLGTAIYTDDKIHGDVFIKRKMLSNDMEGFEVFAADEWELI
jgi:hypothetical protein